MFGESVIVENGYYGSVSAEAIMAEAVRLVLCVSFWLATSAWSGDGWRE